MSMRESSSIFTTRSCFCTALEGSNDDSYSLKRTEGVEEKEKEEEEEQVEKEQEGSSETGGSVNES